MDDDQPTVATSGSRCASGHENPPQNRFCMQCGAAIGDADTAPDPVGGDEVQVDTPPPVAATAPDVQSTASAEPPRPPEVFSPPPAAGGADAVVGRFAEDFTRLMDNIGLVLRGKEDVVRMALVALLAEGHLLLEDVPGVGKTSLARAMAASIDASCQRIQFTPDLLPSDVTGVSIFNQATQMFEFHPGPVFANIVIGDEINRASPKTQSALLEVMEELQVTVDGRPHPVTRPFIVLATQNPIEMDGTYRLPEAQLDRFLLQTSIGYPSEEAEFEIVHAQRRWSEVDGLQPVLSIGAIQRMVDIATGVHVAESISRYIVALVGATRVHEHARLGASPRGALGLARAARVLAASQGRAYVAPEDIKLLAEPVLAHRIMVTPEAEVQGMTSSALVHEVLASVPVPARRGD